MNRLTPTRNRPLLTAALIVRDEQDVLAESLQSVRNIADELIVEDTGSLDNTAEIALHFGARVHRSSWPDSFAAARNACMEHLSGAWTLWLDADERLSEKTAHQLRAFIEQEADPHRAYALMVEQQPLDPGDSSEQIAQVRLIPSGAGLRYAGRVRENMKASLQAAGLEIDAAPGRLLRNKRHHYSDRKRLRAWRDLHLIELEKNDGLGEQSRHFMVEGDSYSLLGHHDKACQSFARAIAIAPPGTTAMLDGYYGLLATLDHLPQYREKQLEVCLKALEFFPFDAQLLVLMGGYLQMRGRMDLAIRSFEMAVTRGQVDLETWHLSELDEVATACWSTSLQLNNRLNEAASVVEEGLQRHPNSARLLRIGLDAAVKCGEMAKAIERATYGMTDPKEQDRLAEAVRGACHAVKKDWLAALTHLQSAYIAGCKHPICLRWLASSLISVGQIEMVRPVLTEWQSIEPHHPELLMYLAALEPKTIDDETESETADIGVDRLSEKKSLEGRHFRLDPQENISEHTPFSSPVTHQSTSVDHG